jgi:hypothetical protein
LTRVKPQVGAATGAVAISRWVEDTTGWSIKKFVSTARRHGTIHIQAGNHTITPTDPIPDDLREALQRLRATGGPH